MTTVHRDDITQRAAELFDASVARPEEDGDEIREAHHNGLTVWYSIAKPGVVEMQIRNPRNKMLYKAHVTRDGECKYFASRRGVWRAQFMFG